VERELWEEIVATMDAASFEEVGGNWIRTHGTAHERRLHEMRQVADVLREMGLEAPMTDATVALFARSTALALRDAFAATPSSPDDTIAALDARMTADTTKDKRKPE
jgi:hypothetical protein